MGEAATTEVEVVRAEEVRSSGGPVAQTLSDAPSHRVLLLELIPGRELPPHRPPSGLILCVLQGTAELLTGDTTRWLLAGEVATVPAGIARGLRCPAGRLVALAIVAPPPGADDHLGGESVAWPVRPSGPDPAALIRSEHRELISGVADLGRLAQRLSGGDVDQLAGEIQTAIEFLKHELLPHAQAEERLIYPKVERVLRAEGGATGTMEYDHRRIERLARDLDGVATAGHSNEARPLLQQLATTVQLHFDKEEELYLPLLSRLGPEEREAMVRSLTGAHPEEPMPQKGVGKDDGERGDE